VIPRIQVGGPNVLAGAEVSCLREPNARMFENCKIPILIALRAIWMTGALATLLSGSLIPLSARAQITPAHERPYFMPERERARIKGLVAREPWARSEFERLRERHRAGDGYAAAFLYALEQDEAYLATARTWLLKYGRAGGDLGQRALEAGPEFFRGGQPWLGDVYYKTDIRPLVAYDWVYAGLTPEERATVEAGILASARFRMRAMDRWSHTPNLVFKPTVMVAVAGLVTGDPELLAWGFWRKPWSASGGYLPVLNLMIRDGGPWGEAPIYPIAHENLSLMAQVSQLLGLMDGQDWFAKRMPGGGSPKALLDYFIDTAYPLERTGYGPGQIRIATYGDGATSASGDLFLVNPAGPGPDLHRELAEAYSITRDPGYAAFLALDPDYRPNLIDRPPLAAAAPYPPAPSKVWPGYGIAMLRSEESPGYWTSDQAIAVFQVMSQGYGHDHRDKFGITLHGAGRLLYPDYNAVQYENPAVGWTRNSVAHNTVVVDAQDTRNAAPSGIRSDFTPGVKFLATSASGVFHGVEQTRALLLTPDYLLDLFHLDSPLPHTYDYLLHSFGRAAPDRPDRFAATDALLKRYWRMQDPQGSARDDQWTLDFVLDETQARQKEGHDIAWLKETRGEQRFKKQFEGKFRFGPQWYGHRAAVRITMAADPGTFVAHGRGPHGLGMLVVRHGERRDTAFVAAHEPFGPGEAPQIRAVSVLARSPEAFVIRIDARDYTDYAAVATGPQKGEPEHALASLQDPGTKFAFKSYGYLRVGRDGRASAWGGWTSFRVPHTIADLEVNGREEGGEIEEGAFRFGQFPARVDRTLVEDPTSPLQLRLAPETVRVFQRDRRRISLTVANPTPREVSGWIEFDAPPGLRLEPHGLDFGPLAPGASEQLAATVVADEPALGHQVVHYRLHHPLEAETAPSRTAAHGLHVMVGPVLERLYQHPKPAVYRVHAPRFTTAFDMFHGLCRYLEDDDGTVRLDGAPLFSFSDADRALLSPTTDHAFTWPKESPASITAQVYDAARYGIDFTGDRMVVRMDPDWTRSEEIHFTVPGEWRAPSGPPKWSSVAGPEKTSSTNGGTIVGLHEKVSAAELAFPASQRSLCFQFLPPQNVTFTKTGLEFTVNGYRGDKWAVGFCPSGRLQDWRWGD